VDLAQLLAAPFLGINGEKVSLFLGKMYTRFAPLLYLGNPLFLKVEIDLGQFLA